MHSSVDHGRNGARVSAPGYTDVEPGLRLPDREFAVGRRDLVRYAGASGDLNPIHWNERAANEAGLPGVIAHGMLTMGLAARTVTEWTGGPDAIAGYRVRFRRPVQVPDSGQTLVVVSGVVTEKLEGRRVTVELTVRCGPTKVLTAAKVVVQMP
ncbi:MaoC/PaaZ C-terminal domain-containing protein [Amycolatopsis sp. H20-H5]|uniref:MaoC/PaaZ C-terminal domain-containing protein n=1 Tax=Amycolatopsis sp. H20-H5 TaxID=3046309 RepID=UPI002DBDBF63|nr:MaoC/PaaZ C-terminal domain-containing protein [Amycolatopsis sp. H20-H5]MEC3977392.1 MaoC/PaaZ C-terminal domain-containing protein [Amycolatopsis sp. H20-H5]